MIIDSRLVTAYTNSSDKPIYVFIVLGCLRVGARPSYLAPLFLCACQSSQHPKTIAMPPTLNFDHEPPEPSDRWAEFVFATFIAMLFVWLVIKFIQLLQLPIKP